MILVDANLLIYAHVSSFPQRAGAREWLDSQLNGDSRVGLPWQSLLAFLRIVTNPRIFEHPESMTSAWAQVESWLDCEVVWIPSRRDRIVMFLVRYSAGPGCSPTWCRMRSWPPWQSSTAWSSARAMEISLALPTFVGGILWCIIKCSTRSTTCVCTDR